MKPSKLQDHLRRCHPDKTEKDLKYLQTLKDKFQKRPTLDRMFASTSQRNDDGLRASYNISLLIAKSGKPHTIGEKLILPAVEEVLKTVLHKPASDIIKRIPLSNNTVERRIDEMSSDIESFLCNYFSIQLDESTLPDNAALLLAHVRFIMNQEIYEELLFARTLITDTKASLRDAWILPGELDFGEAVGGFVHSASVVGRLSAELCRLIPLSILLTRSFELCSSCGVLLKSSFWLTEVLVDFDLLVDIPDEPSPLPGLL
ncbi:unnamed protein product [Acanthoscelides obtectus]|uniref:SCAN domain-containing protein 3 n=1 Tax=Acanthoscelides obtectus TaxID=200917 RepID=A0A9P0QDA7_ACAOB|nr:unnamed protein product [Acanthoscelides obtectus]CAK1686299.1 SCAN domain-containing protein 3 [Acanthoscelides obtectus]